MLAFPVALRAKAGPVPADLELPNCEAVLGPTQISLEACLKRSAGADKKILKLEELVRGEKDLGALAITQRDGAYSKAEGSSPLISPTVVFLLGVLVGSGTVFAVTR